MITIDTLKDHLGEGADDEEAYFQTKCAAELVDEDLTAEGAAFAQAIWKRYGEELADLSLHHDLESSYDFCKQENAEKLRGFLLEFLDEEYEAHGDHE